MQGFRDRVDMIQWVTNWKAEGKEGAGKLQASGSDSRMDLEKRRGWGQGAPSALIITPHT